MMFRQWAANCETIEKNKESSIWMVSEELRAYWGE
jgi:hypothetical protein